MGKKKLPTIVAPPRIRTVKLPTWASNSIKQFSPSPRKFGGSFGEGDSFGETMSRISDQVSGLLGRLRHSIPFPCPKEEVYFECVPDCVRSWVEAGYFDSTPTSDLRMYNLLMMLPTSNPHPSHTSQKFTVQVSLVKGRASAVEECFWMYVDRRVPRPLNSFDTPLVYPPDGKYHHSLQSWAQRALRFDEEISGVYRKVKELSEVVDTSYEMRAVFPDLLSFVQYPQAHRPPPDRNEKARLIYRAKDIINTEEQKRITDLLAAATMLPSKELDAWVGYP